MWNQLIQKSSEVQVSTKALIPVNRVQQTWTNNTYDNLKNQIEELQSIPLHYTCKEIFRSWLVHAERVDFSFELKKLKKMKNWNCLTEDWMQIETAFSKRWKNCFCWKTIIFLLSQFKLWYLLGVYLSTVFWIF